MPLRLNVPAMRDHEVGSYYGKKFQYDYPNNLDLRPGSKLHTKILNEVLQRAQDSYDVMSTRHRTWREIDQTLTAYIPLDAEEKRLKEKDKRKPVSIVVPHSYATLETLLTYMASAFLDMPYFRYESDDVVPVAGLEAVIAMQCQNFKTGLNLMTSFRDGFAYGFGAASPIWTQKWGWKTKRSADGSRERTPEILYEGNKIDNIDPYLYLPDPNVAVHEVQQGEYVGFIDRTNYLALLEAEKQTWEDGSYFNVAYLNGLDGRTNLLTTATVSGRDIKTGVNRDSTLFMTTNPVDVIYMYITLVPKEWELGKEEYPVKYLFGVAADEIVIMAAPCDLDHDLYPIAINAPDYDGYSLTPVSRIEMIYGLQGILDFLFTSHVTNVRKAINDMLIVDPYLINMRDLEDPAPGKLVRMRRAAWGKGVENAVKQLTVTDVTRSNMTDAGQVMDIIARSSAAVDSLQGIMRQSSERRSATEARDARMSALSRLAKTAKISSLMFMHDLAVMVASQTQQLMDVGVYITNFGRYQQQLQEEYAIAKGKMIMPSDLNLYYQTVIHDGTIEVGEHADTWVQLYQILATNPAIGSGFDMVRIFRHLARMAGAKNVNEFVRKGGSANIKTMQDQQVLNEAAKGNMIPVGGTGIGKGLGGVSP